MHYDLQVPERLLDSAVNRHRVFLATSAVIEAANFAAKETFAGTEPH